MRFSHMNEYSIISKRWKNLREIPIFLKRISGYELASSIIWQRLEWVSPNLNHPCLLQEKAKENIKINY